VTSGHDPPPSTCHLPLATFHAVSNAADGHEDCIVVDCCQSSIHKLDTAGKFKAQAEVNEIPVKTLRLSDTEAVIATNEGEVIAWRVR